MSKFTKERYQEIQSQLKELIDRGMSCSKICKHLGITKSTVFRQCNLLGLHIPNHHNSLKFDNTVFDRIDTEEKAYWLGFLYADGYVSGNSNIVSLSLKGSDISHLEKFKRFLQTSSVISLKTVNNCPVCSL